MFKKIISVFILILLISSCNPSYNSIVGCYSIEEDGKAIIKITKEQDNYFIFERGQEYDDEWSDKIDADYLSREEIIDIFGD